MKMGGLRRVDQRSRVNGAVAPHHLLVLMDGELRPLSRASIDLNGAGRGLLRGDGGADRRLLPASQMYVALDRNGLDHAIARVLRQLRRLLADHPRDRLSPGAIRREAVGAPTPIPATAMRSDGSS